MKDKISIRELKYEDRRQIEGIISQIDNFTEEEKNCAKELLGISLETDEGDNGYKFLVAEGENKNIYGFVCYGKIPLTERCYDIYWIACTPSFQGKGIGTRLLNRVESILKNNNARKLIIETSFLDSYRSTINFYKKRGFEIVSQIKDFYNIGNDKLTFLKNL